MKRYWLPLTLVLIHAGSIVGQIVAWKWEGLGGVLIVGGFVLFSIVNGRLSLNIAFGPWLGEGEGLISCRRWPLRI
jgi:hypothetical protein